MLRRRRDASLRLPPDDNGVRDAWRYDPPSGGDDDAQAHLRALGLGTPWAVHRPERAASERELRAIGNALVLDYGLPVRAVAALLDLAPRGEWQ